MDKIIDLLFPAACYLCEKGDGPICKKCEQEFLVLNTRQCIVCEKESILGTTHLDCITSITPISFLAAYSYANYVREAIRISKYSKRQFYCLKHLTKLACRQMQQLGLKLPNKLVVVPIPLSIRKLKARGFNQTEVIAKTLAKEFNLRVNTRILKRERVTQAQFLSSRKDRFDNVYKAFAVSKYQTNILDEAQILLVDDICTTGATLLSAAKALYQAGAKEVHCFTLAKMLKSRK